ncbi:MAG: diaminopimelate epimerase [Lachnospiraceae bacterium]
MEFTKMHGCGNDYVYVDCTQNELTNPGEIAVKISDRHFGIGSDGLILIKKSDKADFFMEMYNADGSQGKMCGNGIRCVGKYVYDNGLTSKTDISVETLSGIKYLKLNVIDGRVKTVCVNMGSPILNAADIPVKTGSSDNSNPVINEPITIDGQTYRMTCVSMGNPHAVVFVDSTDDFPVDVIGPKFENNPVFPERTNTEFVEFVDRAHLKMRVWERGSGETWACGTGTCATVVAAVLNGLCDNSVEVKLLGGILNITWDRNENVVYMEGPAETVFTGTIEI